MNGEKTFRARLSSAQHPAGIDAEVRAGMSGLAITTSAGDEHWSWDSLRLRPGSFGGGAQMEHIATGALLVFPDQAVLAELRVHAPGRAPAAATEAARRAMNPLVVLSLAALLLVAGAWLALPHAAAAVARSVPLEWEEQFGDAVVGSLAPESKRLTDSTVTRPIEQLVARLAASQESPYRFRVVVSSDSAVNAFAAPGGRIVVNAGLISLAASADELAGVLAHEIEHVRKRHVTVSLFQKLSLQMLMAVVLGESGGVLGGGAEVAKRLADLSYGRSAELEADRGGAGLMHAAGLDPQAMIDVLERMRSKSSAAPPELLSTHPATASRVAALREVIQGLGAVAETPALEARIWEQVRAAAARHGGR